MEGSLKAEMAVIGPESCRERAAVGSDRAVAT